MLSRFDMRDLRGLVVSSTSGIDSNCRLSRLTKELLVPILDLGIEIGGIFILRFTTGSNSS